MRELFKKFYRRIIDALYGMLPILILLGIPTMICIIIGWDYVVKIFNALTESGNGSFIFGLVVFIFKLIGLINLFVGFMLTIETISKKLSRKLIYIYFIVTLLSVIVYILL